jgi:L-fucose mutarotase
MINGAVIHPEILRVLASSGHGSNILIADGHFPFSTGGPASASRVYLNYSPGLIKVPDILEPLLKMIDVEAVAAPVPDDDSEPPIFPEYRKLLPKNLEIRKLKRFDFYAAVNTPNTTLLIASGDTRTYACILLTFGVRKF